MATNFTRKDRYTIKEEVFRLINQQENTDKDQDLQFLEVELAKLFIANQDETAELNEELYIGKWLFDEFQPSDENTGIGYFVFPSPVGFTPGVLAEQNDEITIKAWPALLSVIKAERVIKKIQLVYYKSQFIVNSKLTNMFYNRLVETARPGKIPQTFACTQQKNLYEEILYFRDLSESSPWEEVRLHKLLSTKPVSLNLFSALDNKRKLISTNHWEVSVARKKWMGEKKIADQQIQFVQLEKEKLYYGLYSH